MTEHRKIGLREVRALEPGSIVWDGTLPGFGARRQQDSTSYVLKYRTREGRQRWHTIGRHGAPWTPETARAEALRLLGEIVKGLDPAAEKHTRRQGITVATLCRLYLADAEAGRLLMRGGTPKKKLTLASDRGRIEGHIIPLLGRLPVATVTKMDIERFMHAVAEGETARQTKTGPRGLSQIRGGRGVATRSIGLLGAVFAYAIDHRMRADNPAHGVRKYAENRRTRRLSDTEYPLLGAALHQAEATIWPPAVACTRFLALTGWRSGEALALRLRDIDLARRTAVLPDTKSGRSVRPLSNAACDLLRTQSRFGEDALVFPATRGDGPMLGFKKFVTRIIAKGGLPADITPHVLRHSFASLAADLGYSEPTIGALVGHRSSSMTGRYIHSADAVLLAAADVVANATALRMGEVAPEALVITLRG
jgi:integrase